jgi:hypothetical protein
MLGYLDRQVEELKNAGRPLGGFFSHIAKQTRKHLSNIVKLNAELVEFRMEIQSLPASRNYNYPLAPSKE